MFYLLCTVYRCPWGLQEQLRCRFFPVGSKQPELGLPCIVALGARGKGNLLSCDIVDGTERGKEQAKSELEAAMGTLRSEHESQLEGLRRQLSAKNRTADGLQQQLNRTAEEQSQVSCSLGLC